MKVRAAIWALALALVPLSLARGQSPRQFKGGEDYAPQWPVKPEGKTSIRAHLGKAVVEVTVVTTEVQLDFSSKAPPRYVQCTYSRKPCSLTNLIGVAVRAVPELVYRASGEPCAASFKEKPHALNAAGPQLLWNRSDGRDLVVPSEAYASLGDIDTIAVAGTAARPMLVINGGDAAAGYDARFLFNRERLLECIVYLGEADFPPPMYTMYFTCWIRFIRSWWNPGGQYQGAGVKLPSTTAAGASGGGQVGGRRVSGSPGDGRQSPRRRSLHPGRRIGCASPPRHG